MDISKLPKLSQTPSPPPADEASPTAVPPEAGFPVAVVPNQAPTVWCRTCNAPNPSGTRFCGNCGAELTPSAGTDIRSADVGGGAEAWISIGLGVILLLMNPRLFQYIFHVCFGTHFAPYVMDDGTEVPYTDQLDFWSDLGITLFGIVLIIDGFVLFIARRRTLLWIAFALTVATTAYNAGYLAMTFSRGGLAIISAFAVLFGGFIAAYQWRLLQSTRPR